MGSARARRRSRRRQGARDYRPLHVSPNTLRCDPAARAIARRSDLLLWVLFTLSLGACRLPKYSASERRDVPPGRLRGWRPSAARGDKPRTDASTNTPTMLDAPPLRPRLGAKARARIVPPPVPGARHCFEYRELHHDRAAPDPSASRLLSACPRCRAQGASRGAGPIRHAYHPPPPDRLGLYRRRRLDPYRRNPAAQSGR